MDAGTATTAPPEPLDAALDRVSALEFAPPGHFVNHAPMACEALVELGYESALPEWTRDFESYLVAAAGAEDPGWAPDFDWRARLGDGRLLPQWLGWFGRAVQEDGWRPVVSAWMPRLMPGLSAALYHGVIRTSHAVRALDRADTPARRAELARALASWAVWSRPSGPDAGGADPSGVDLSGVDPSGADAAGGYPPGAILAVAAAGARNYVSDPSIAYLHGVTGAMAVHLLSGFVAPGDASDAVAHLAAAHRSLYRGARPEDPGPTEAGWDDAVVEVAAGSLDAHQVKLVEACRRGYRATQEEAFAVAARIVTSGRR